MNNSLCFCYRRKNIPQNQKQILWRRAVRLHGKYCVLAHLCLSLRLFFSNPKIQSRLYDIAIIGIMLAIVALLCVGCKAHRETVREGQQQVALVEARMSIVEVHGALRMCSCVIGRTPQCECEEVEP